MSLSDKGYEIPINTKMREILFVKDVKEFIKEDLKLMNKYRIGEITWLKFLEERKKLVGDKLI